MKCCLLILAFACVALAFEDVTVSEWMVVHGYNTMSTLLNKTGLEARFSASGSSLTVFAPTDAAFLLSGISANPSPSEIHRLSIILEYHVVSEFILVPLVHGYMKVMTLEGHNITLHQITRGAMINNGTHIKDPDHICNNGVVQGIDHVLSVPVSITHTLNIAQILIRDEAKFRDFTLSLMMVGMLSLLETSDFTLMVPSNNAVGRLAQDINNPNQPRADLNQGIELMKYYMVPGGRTSSQLHDGQQLFTLHGHRTPINVTISSSGDIMMNDAHVVEADIIATNGVIFLLDNILTPQDVIDEISSGHPSGK